MPMLKASVSTEPSSASGQNASPPSPRLPMKMRAVLAVAGIWKSRQVVLTSLPW